MNRDRLGATHELALARAAIALAWPDARRDGRAHGFDAAYGELRATVAASCEPGWIAVRASGLPHLDARDALAWNGALAGGVCFAANPRGDAELRATIAIEPEAPLALRLRAVRAGIIGALARVAMRSPATPAAASDASDTSFDAAAAARDAGFAVSARPDGRCAVDLGCGPVAASAEVAPHGAGVAARIELLERSTLDADSRAALQCFLLRANAAFRMTRAVLEDSGEATRARLEIVFDTEPSQGEWRLALGALAVATRHTQREATALVDDPEFARAFLALAPRSRPASRTSRNRFEEAGVRPWAPNAPA